MLHREDVRTDIGRCTGGSFVRVTHLPSRIARQKGPRDGEAVPIVEARLLAEIERELVGRGSSQYIIPADRVGLGRADA